MSLIVFKSFKGMVLKKILKSTLNGLCYILFLFPVKANHSVKVVSIKLRMHTFKVRVILINFLYSEILVFMSMLYIVYNLLIFLKF